VVEVSDELTSPVKDQVPELPRRVIERLAQWGHTARGRGLEPAPESKTAV
jgi:hypothetical protein